MEIIYADSLFLLNLIIDYLLLVLSFRLCDRPIRRIRCLLGALTGAAYAVMCFLPGLGYLETPIFKIALWVIISLITFGKEQYLLKCALSFLTISAVFGGGVWAASMLSGMDVYASGPVRMSLGTLIFSFALCYAFLSLTFSRKMRAEGGQVVSAEIWLRGRQLTLTALRDSGNCLREQISGKLVLAIGAEDISPLFTERELAALREHDGIGAMMRLSAMEGAPKFRPVYYSALGTACALIPAFTPDKLVIDGKATGDYVIAVSPTPIGGGEYTAVI